MSWGKHRRISALVGTVLLLGGCSGESDEPAAEATSGTSGLGALELVRFLPQDGESYSTVDLVAVRSELGLADDADPITDGELSAFAGQTLNGVFAAFPDQSVIDALDLPAATAAASGSGFPDGAVSMVASSADPGDVEQALLDLGFVDHGGVLEGPDGERANPLDPEGTAEDVSPSVAGTDSGSTPSGASAVRFVDGGFLVSDSGELLRSLNSEAAGLPFPIQSAIEGDATHVLQPPPGPDVCIRAQGIATSADGSGVLAFDLKGEPDPSRVSGPDPSDLGEPVVEGSRLVVPIELDEPTPPLEYLNLTLAGYDCPE